MNILYGPWFAKYMLTKKNIKDQTSRACVFCQKFLVQDLNSQEFILKKAKHASIILNFYPYNPGHLLILPYQHVANLEDLSKEARMELMELTNKSIIILESVLKVHGIHVGLNLGETSGSIPDHVHLHVVPRFDKDINFLVKNNLLKNRLIDLEKVYNDLKPAFQALEI